MGKYKNNFIFVVLILLFSVGIFVLNYYYDPIDARGGEKCYIYWSHSRKYVNIKIKASKKFKYDTLVLGTSITSDLFPNPERYDLPRIILFEMSMEEMYKIIQMFFDIHKETKHIFLPLEIHSVFFDHKGGIGTIPEYNYNPNFTLSEFIHSYYTVEITKKSLQYLKADLKNEHSEDDDWMLQNSNPTISVLSECRLFPPNISKLSKSKIKDDYYYWGKILDFLQERNVKITCFIPPANYIYLQDAMTDEKLKVLNDLKYLTVSKGIEIYDFSKKNKYNEESMKKSYLFADLVHPNFIYGNIIYKTLTHKLDDKSLYRIITKDNIDECIKLSVKELDEYKKTHQNLIKEYYTYDYDIAWDNKTKRKFTSLKEIPEKYRVLNE